MLVHLSCRNLRASMADSKAGQPSTTTAEVSSSCSVTRQACFEINGAKDGNPEETAPIRVAVVGRTLEEYVELFGLDLAELQKSKPRILDAPSGQRFRMHAMQ